MDSRLLNPRKIPDNFRMQTYIEEALKNADRVLEKITRQEWIDLALTYMEKGDWNQATFCRGNAAKGVQSDSSEDREIKATIHYISATTKREQNDCEQAIREYQEAEKLAQSDWLKGNLIRNLGLVYLKQTEFTKAAEIFKQGVEFLEGKSEFAGSLPAMKNYHALTKTRAALKDKKDSHEGLKLFAETTALYEKIFAERNISENEKLKSHDFQSHQFHRGMILCEIAESENKDNKSKEKFLQAEELLIGAFRGRKENKADGQRLGDTAVWLGRVAVGLNNLEIAKNYFEQALEFYREVFPSKLDAPEAKQIQDVKARLEKLKLFMETQNYQLSKQNTFAQVLIVQPAVTQELRRCRPMM